MSIFGLQYGLVVAGYAATAFLLGNYMLLYTRASELELGLIFTIQPAVIIASPLVCSLADRFQCHRSIYLYCALASFLSHLPFILIPFITDTNHDLQATTTAGLYWRIRFWVLVVSHFVGCVCFCCMRTLGDVLTVNYCRRMGPASGCSYTQYRKWGPISFGVCSLSLGYVNTRYDIHGLPSYVPGFLLYSTCHLILFALFYLWPSEFFVIVSEVQITTERQARELPSSREVKWHIRRKLLRLLTCGLLTAEPKSHMAPNTTPNEKEANIGHTRTYLDLKQQAQIFYVLFKRDERIALYLLILAGCGLCGHSVQNFVYVYLAKICQQTSGDNKCQSSSLAGYIMAGICITETLAYSLASNWLKTTDSGPKRMLKIQLALTMLVGHYLCLGSSLVTQQSGSYFFLVECLHGAEFGLMIATCIEWGDLFANEVSLIIPELIERRIIQHDQNEESHRRQLDLVRVSLIATMLACFLFAYDGLGGVIGGLMYGLVIDRYGFAIAFQLNALLASLLLCVITTISLMVDKRRLKNTNSRVQFA